MFGRNGAKSSGNKARNLQLGLFEVPSDIDVTGGAGMDDGDDSDLEAELLALSSGGNTRSRPKRQRLQGMPQGDLDAMVAASLKDDPDDEDIPVDENDPELLSELQEIAGDELEPEEISEESPTSEVKTPMSTDVLETLKKRFEMYQQAEQNAKSQGETSRARRYGRAIKTLKDLIKQAEAGRSIDESAIPPEVSVTLKKHEEAPVVPSRPAPAIPASDSTPPPTESPVAEDEHVIDTSETPHEPPVSVDNSEVLNLLNERIKQYKIAAVTAKRAGNTQAALQYVKAAKQFEAVIIAVQNGETTIDISKIPGPPESLEHTKPEIEESEAQKESSPEEPAADEAPAEDLITASSVAEALEQRLEFFKKQEAAAKEEGNSSKARRLGRVIKQFEQAIKLNKAGKPINVDDLPAPPGFAPIPVPRAAAPQSPPQGPSKPKETVSPTPSTSGSKVPATKVDKQVALLLAKQKEFKLAALNAKKKGEINEAKEYLRQAKGFDRLIDMARGGLRIDLGTLPISPSQKTHLDEDVSLNVSPKSEDDTANSEVLMRLEVQLTKQLKMCLNTRDHNKSIGDVAAANRFERLALNVTKDLDVIRMVRRTPGASLPKFHYENREFSVVNSFTDLGDNDLQISVLRGVNFPCSDPEDMSTYVKFEFPYPQDSHFTDKTATVKSTNNPEYNTTVTVPINRSARNCQRLFKRHNAKFEVYSKGGWFKGDTLIGTANVKLLPLETQCEIHDSFDLADGRKKVGGKLEVRIRVRHPIQTQEVKQIHEKWLVIDS